MIEKVTPEPGSLLRTAARDADLGFHVTASWADVQRKAKRIRAEGGVTIVVASSDGIGGHVVGDHGTYESLLVYRPGTRKIADWGCGCAWSAFAFDRSPAFKRFEGRKCSHALALQFEAQSQGMFGKEVHPAEVPTGRSIVKFDPDSGEHVFARPYQGSLIGSLVARLRAEDADPAEVIGRLVTVGFRHAAAVTLWKTAETEDPPGPKVSGIALKAHDTGRVLMLQRGQEDGDPASGRWEFPGGHHEDGDLTSLHAGLREWQEEVGQEFPANGAVKHTWSSPNGVYQGHVVVIPSEKDLSMKDGRVVPNPDDPHGDNHEQAAWWEIAHAKGNKALRDEVREHTPWKEIEKASLDAPKQASGSHPWSDESDHHDIDSGAETYGEMPIAHPDDTPYHNDDRMARAHITHETFNPHQDHVEALQDWLSKPTLDHFADHPEQIHAHGPVDILHDTETGERYMMNGHHRVTVMRAKGIPGTLPARVHHASRTASAWDPISNTNPQPGRGTTQPAHSNTTNPASTGFAASDDPDNWNNLDADPEPLTPSLGFDAVLHAPAPALPVTYGDEDATMRPAEMQQSDLDPIPDNPPQPAYLVPDQDSDIHLLDGGSSLPNSYHGSTEKIAEIVAEFQRTAAAQALVAPQSDDDIAEAARAHLEKTGAAKFTFAEQQELIGEAPEARARNFGALKIEGTHYELLQAALDNQDADSSDLFI